MKEEYDRKLELAKAIIREQRDVLDKSENVLDKPDGYITFVDLERREVQVNINRHQGARPQMKMTVFDADSPGVPTEKPKGNIQLIQVGDQYSIARIERVVSTIDPDPGRRHRLLARLVAGGAYAVRPDWQDRRQPRRQGRSAGSQADDRGRRRRGRL